jgi:hypothetical protein
MDRGPKKDSNFGKAGQTDLRESDPGGLGMKSSSEQRGMRWLYYFLTASFAITALAPDSFAGEAKVELLATLDSGFFAKKLDYCGVPIKAHRDVDNRAFLEARRRLARMLDQAPDIAYNLAQAGAELHIIGKDQQTSDLPYLRHLKGKPYEVRGTQVLTIDTRTRGIGGLQASCGEENLLKLPSDRYREHRDICTHEFAHTVLAYGLSSKVRKMVASQYRASIKEGRWKTAYAASNVDEFFAELSMWYVGSRGDYGKIEPPPKPGPEWLRKYDPDAFRLLDDIYSGRQKVQRVVWTVLAQHPAKDEPKMRSESSSEPTTVLFENHTETVCKLFWLSTTGRREPYGEIRPGEKRGQHTFATHPWVVVKPDGAILGIYVAEKRPGKAIFQ